MLKLAIDGKYEIAIIIIMCSDILIAGYSFGGMVAYEMASELKRNNEIVAMVFMVDTYAWFPKALTNCSEYIKKCAEINLKSMKKLVVN
jgi:thioesterase domain-containing protein